MSNNQIRKYCDSIKKQFGEDVFVKLSKGEFEENSLSPFLSVVIRTQGTRIQSLSEVFLCLNAQSCKNFNIFLMCHNIGEQDKKSLKALINMYPSELTNKITIIEVNGGTRTTPLIKGFDAANGQYIAILDDDDYVFDNWVSTFYELFKKNNGRLLHAFCVEQDWEIINTKYGISAMSTSGYSPTFCEKFDLVQQLSINKCPIMSIAFPAYVYKALHISFNEELTTTEDWDFIMKSYLVCGICDSENVTSIYRKWKQNDTSLNLHKKEEWDRNYKIIRDNLLDEITVCETSQLEKYVIGGDIRTADDIEIFVNTGNGFLANQTLEYNIKKNSQSATICIQDFSKYQKIISIRFDPAEYGVFSMENLDIAIYDYNNTKIPFTINFSQSNCIKINNKYYFLGIDPQIEIIPKKTTTISEIHIQYNVNFQLTVTEISYAGISLSVRKPIRYLKRIFNKIKSRS